MAPRAVWDDVPLVAAVQGVIRRYYTSLGADSRYVKTPMGRVHVYDVGDGPPSVLVHGLGDSAHTWHLLLPALAKTRRLVLMDLPGHGYSDTPSRGYATIPEMVDAVQDVLQDLDEDAGLVGHSLGGWITAKTAARRPMNLARLVLLEAGGWTHDGWEDTVALLQVTSPSDVARLWTEACGGRVPWQLTVTRHAVAELFQMPYVADFLKNTPEDHAITPDEVARIDVPTLVVGGKRDGLVLPVQAEMYAANIADAELAWLDAGHTPQLTHRGELVRLLDAVLPQDGVKGGEGKGD